MPLAAPGGGLVVVPRGDFLIFDVGRIEHVHLWPFWGGWEGELGRYTREHGIAFVMGRTDWEYLHNCFCIGYRTGYQFVATKAGAPNAVLTQCGSDIGPCAVRVEAAAEAAAEAAILFGNRIRGRLRIDNQAGERTQTWLNVVTP